MDIKQFFFYTSIVFFLSCSGNEHKIIQAFNQGDYTTVQDLLQAEPDSWKKRLYLNKRSIELQNKLPYSLAEIKELYLRDSLKNKFSLEQIYARFHLKPRKFVQTLMELSDAEQKIKKTSFYYAELFRFLESKREENRRFALTKISSNFNYRYRTYFYESARRILNDSLFSSNYKDHIRKMASFMDRFDKESAYYDSNLVDYPYQIVLENENILRKRKSLFDASIRTEIKLPLEEMNSCDFYLLEQEQLEMLSDRIFNSKKLAYSFILADRKLDVKNRASLRPLYESKLPELYQNYISEQLHFAEEDSCLELLLVDSIPLFAKIHFLDEIKEKSYSTKRMTAYFSLFKEAKLQARLEKQIVKFRQDSLSYFLKDKLNSELNRDLSYALYLIGKARLKRLETRVRDFLSHANRNVKFEAEQTIIRLK